MKILRSLLILKVHNKVNQRIAKRRFIVVVFIFWIYFYYIYILQEIKCWIYKLIKTVGHRARLSRKMMLNTPTFANKFDFINYWKVTVAMFQTTKKYFYCYCSCQFVKRLLKHPMIFLDLFNNCYIEFGVIF